MKLLSLTAAFILIATSISAQEKQPRFRINVGPMLSTTNISLNITPSPSDPCLTQPFTLNLFEGGAGISTEGAAAITNKLWINTGINISANIADGESSTDKLNMTTNIPLIFTYDFKSSKSTPFIGLGVMYNLRERNSFFVESDGTYTTYNDNRSFTIQCPDREYSIKNKSVDLAFRVGKFMQTNLNNVYKLELMANYSLNNLFTPRIGPFIETGTGSLYTIGLKISSTNYYYKAPNNRLPNKK